MMSTHPTKIPLPTGHGIRHHVWRNIGVWYAVDPNGEIRIEQMRTPTMLPYRPPLEEIEQAMSDIKAMRKENNNE